MLYFKYIFVLSAILTITGCASKVKNLDENYTIGNNPKESVLIMGINRNYQVTFLDGRIIEKDLFIIDSFVTGMMVQPENDYIVVPLKLEEGSSTHYGIHAFLEYGFLFQLYMPCGGDLTTAFQIPAGEIGYIGEHVFGNIKNDKLDYKVHYDMDKLKKFLEEKYPNLADKTVHKIKLEKFRYDSDPLSCEVNLEAELPIYD